MRFPPTTLTPEAAARELADRRSSPPIADPPPVALPGDAWERRLLMALADHVPRQQWVAHIVEEHLSASTRLLATDGAFGHPENLAQRGPVPTMADWSYLFHGRGCCLTHRDGTAIDVDFDERGADGIDPFFYARYLDSLSAPRGIEQLLRHPEPLSNAWMADLNIFT